VTQQVDQTGATSAIGQDLPPEPVTDVEPKTARRLDPGFKRNLLIIGGALVAAAIVVFGLFAMRSGGDNKKNSGVNVNLPQGTTDNGGDQPMSPAMQDALRKKQLAEQASARARGEPLFIPQDTTAAPVPIEARQTAINPAPTTQSTQVLQPSEDDRARNDRRRQGMERQIGSLLAMSDTGAAAPQRVTFDQRAQSGGGAGAARAEPASAGASAAARRRLMRIMQVLPLA